MRVKVLHLASLLIAVFLSSSAAQAFEHNFLLGGEIGVESRHSHFTTRYQSPTELDPGLAQTLHVSSTRIVDAGSFMGLLGGWQFRCHRWLAGIEANVDFHSFEEHHRFFISDTSPRAGTVEYDRGTTYGLILRGGYWITPFFMGYIKAGVQFSRDELTFADSPVAQFLGEPINSEKDDIWGGVAGVGVEIPAFGRSSVRAEFNYVRTDRFVIDDNVGALIGTHRVRYPQSYIGKLAWVWNFT